MGEGRCRRQPGEDGVRESLRCLWHVPLAGKGDAVSAGAIYRYVVSNADLSHYCSCCLLPRAYLYRSR